MGHTIGYQMHVKLLIIMLLPVSHRDLIDGEIFLYPSARIPPPIKQQSHHPISERILL